ncbi:hypothetical protein G6720_05455 [Polynucleobacter paneuropaeus]|nr:hypothetical protein G6720_05455 [Polynucleobacter paneuropaeus]
MQSIFQTFFFSEDWVIIFSLVRFFAFTGTFLVWVTHHSACKVFINSFNGVNPAITALSEQLAQSRDARIEAAAIRLPSIYWFVIALTFLAVAGISGILESDNLATFQLSLLMMALAGMVSLVFAFDRPFLGDSGVKPGAIEKAIEGMDERHSELKSPKSIKFSHSLLAFSSGLPA